MLIIVIIGVILRLSSLSLISNTILHHVLHCDHDPGNHDDHPENDNNPGNLLPKVESLARLVAGLHLLDTKVRHHDLQHHHHHHYHHRHHHIIIILVQSLSSM